ncbi:MAG: hypothetical protein IPJ28_00960 [Betaproteobacteria bacterium]|nr:hypothetical protein [Betaproteobacteria bacterium]
MPAERFSVPLDRSAAQSAYAELASEVTRQQDPAPRAVGNLSGSFNRKRVKNATYWYYQYTESPGGGTRQVFVGPDDGKVRASREKSSVCAPANPP